MRSLPDSEALSRIVIALLADAAFVFAEPASAAMPSNEDPLVARLTIEHGETWELCVCVQGDLGSMLAANLLGTESESSEAHAAASDAVGEMTNILAGALSVEIFGKDVVCHIGIPVVAVEPGRTLASRLAKSACRANLVTEEGYLLSVALGPQGDS